MRALEIDFEPGAAAGQRARAGGWFALAAVALAIAVLAQPLAGQQDALEALQQREEILSERLHPTAARKAAADDPALARRMASANEAIEQLAVPWDALFRGLESADARGLGLLSVLPDARQRTLQLSGEARSVPEVFAYVDRLSAVPVLAQVHLAHYETVQRDGATVVSFTLGAAWQAR